MDNTPKDNAKNNEGSIEITNGVLILRVNLLQEKGKFLAKGLLAEGFNVVDQFAMEMAMKKARNMNAIIKPSVIRPDILRNGNGQS